VQAVYIVCKERSVCDFETIATPTRVGGRGWEMWSTVTA
jgi:hypothetical protein